MALEDEQNGRQRERSFPFCLSSKASLPKRQEHEPLNADPHCEAYRGSKPFDGKPSDL